MENASRRVADDPTLSYTVFVAALEALAPDDIAPPFPWSDLDGRKRKLIDTAVTGLGDEDVERIRSAVIEAEGAGAKTSFRGIRPGQHNAGLSDDRLTAQFDSAGLGIG